MSETDPGTGEVFETEAEREVAAMLTPTGAKMNPKQLVAYEPPTPELMEQYIIAMGDRLGEFASVIVALYSDVHEATRVYNEAFSVAVLEGKYTQISFARQYAVQATADQARALDHAKEKLRYAEEMQKAMISRHMGFMNVNKSISQQFMGARRFS